ncbi:MAG: ATP-dependent DNA helicase RecG [Planctomycetales bacterium]|nr:ATP-dependent DNA helicase RecG [Planctomycetales bacterium]
MTPERPRSSRLLESLHSQPAVGPQQAALLAKLGLHKTADLLFFFPRTYEAVAPLQSEANFVEHTRVAFVGTVLEMAERVTQSGKHVLGVLVAPDGGGAVRLTWFNQPFRKNGLQVGQRLVATGVLRSTVLHWEMVQPQIQLLAAGEERGPQGPVPVYALTEGLKQTALRKIMRQVLPELIAAVDEVLPESLRTRLEVPAVQTALHGIHFPESMEVALAAQRRFKTQELLVLQLAITLQRREREQQARAPQCRPTGKIHARILNRLPYTLTADQQRAIAEIGHDMACDQPMNRLLQGDVGSGKTLVAQYAMLLCAAYGYQAALMAPTEVLARQHSQTLQRSLAASRVRVELLSGSMGRAERATILGKLSEGKIDLLVGTQALLSADVAFHNLGLVIVDEQHKFGVVQRAKLRTEASQPHYLVLSATPIPRTIAMTAFGDLDVSTIRQKPPGRAPVNTYLATPEGLDSWWQFVDRQLQAGRQAYVIAPRVAETDGGEVASAEGYFHSLQQGPLRHHRIGLLHGRLDSGQKEEVLSSFAAGELDILVATTVVEVGIDVPNATVMTILDANRLGLSQLHQLRGRVSRGAHSGYVCAITARGCGAEDNQRLKAFEKSDDGFELAEMDLRLRGPGDLLGTSQSGLPPLRIANLLDDAPLLALARQVAKEILEEDPSLSAPEWKKLRRQTVLRYGPSMQLSDVG